ncbi:hypothetical protein FQN54_000353 [Arachnomyces sp. PD_36]|nr:hypothetical protein FQN54_000353 [Arachnomyces sp. PD_36]
MSDLPASLSACSKMSLPTLPLDILLEILDHLHILDIFPLKMAGNRRITDAIHAYFPLSSTRIEYIESIVVESYRRNGIAYRTPSANQGWDALKITLSRGQLNLVLARAAATSRPRRSPLRFWTGRIIKRLFRVKSRRERISSFFAREGSRYPLHIAAQYGAVLSVKPILRAGGGWVDCRDLRGMTPLHYAVQGGWEAVVSELLDMGADVWTQDDCRCTAVSLATEGREKKILQMLLDHAWSGSGSGLFWYRGDLKHARDLAVKRGLTDMLELLSRKGSVPESA